MKADRDHEYTRMGKKLPEILRRLKPAATMMLR